jgi:hypothetical protein
MLLLDNRNAVIYGGGGAVGGAIRGTLLADLSMDEFMPPIEGFLRSLFITSKAVARHMGHKRPGVSLTLSTPGSKLPAAGCLGYTVSCASKEAFSRVLAAELATSLGGMR